MAKRKINGIFLLDKPEGITSSTALVKTRAIFKGRPYWSFRSPSLRLIADLLR